MCNSDLHLNQYKHNRRFATHGIRDCEGFEFLDWRITAYFYSVLHLVEYVLVNECGVVSSNHDNRKNFMRDNPTIFHKNNIMKDYLSLETLSKLARYTAGSNVDKEDVKMAFIYMENLEFALKKYVKETETNPT